eukprot:scaffold537_cov241-Pinguiococcus_pyrenoidosus.AAC.25
MLSQPPQARCRWQGRRDITPFRRTASPNGTQSEDSPPACGLRAATKARKGSSRGVAATEHLATQRRVFDLVSILRVDPLPLRLREEGYPGGIRRGAGAPREGQVVQARPVAACVVLVMKVARGGLGLYSTTARR